MGLGKLFGMAPRRNPAAEAAQANFAQAQQTASLNGQAPTPGAGYTNQPKKRQAGAVNASPVASLGGFLSGGTGKRFLTNGSGKSFLGGF